MLALLLVACALLPALGANEAQSRCRNGTCPVEHTASLIQSSGFQRRADFAQHRGKASDNVSTEKGLKDSIRVGQVEGCWSPCGNKSGYCLDCAEGSPVNLWRACCRRHKESADEEEDPVCGKVKQDALDASQFRCVDVEEEQFTDRVPWLRKLEIAILNVQIEKEIMNAGFKFTSDLLDLNRVEVTRVSLQKNGSSVKLRVEGINFDVVGDGKVFLKALGKYGNAIPIGITASLKEPTALKVNLKTPVTHREHPKIDLGTCKLSDFVLDLTGTTGTTGTDADNWIELLAGLLSGLISNLLEKALCEKLSCKLMQALNPTLEEFALSHHPEVINESKGMDCFGLCGGHPGWCPFCGPGHACCSMDSEGNTTECSNLVPQPEIAPADHSTSSFGAPQSQCYESTMDQPWMESLVYRQEQLKIMWYFLYFKNLKCGNANLNTILVDINRHGFNLNLVGLDFSFECTGQVRLLGIPISTLFVALQPGYHASVDIETQDPQEPGNELKAEVTKCTFHVPLKLKFIGTMMMALRNLVPGRWLERTLEKDTCLWIKNIAWAIGSQSINQAINRHELDLAKTPTPSPPTPPTPPTWPWLKPKAEC